ncbi:MAG: DegT/DnrJ/EryC1/StrS family aminotransferase [Thermoproteota archaeon]
MSAEISERIYDDVKRFFAINQQQKFVRGKTKISLQVPSFGADEINEAIESLLSTWLTMGKKVRMFEEAFASYLGSKYAVMVNSGSSANLLSLSILTNPQYKGYIPAGSEVITPAVTWVTTVYPIANVNLLPVLVDIEVDTFCIDTDQIRKAITPKTKAIMPVHLLGNPANMDEIMEIASKHDLYVIEDTCESHGAEINGDKVGTIGDIGTFSFFLSHHITTIEGGMLVTDDERIYEIAKAMRAFGWIRDLKEKEKIVAMHKDLDSRFLFVNMGYNFRPTEIQGAFGIHQIKKLEKFINIRQKNADYWNKRLEQFSDYFIIHKQRPKTRHVWFAYQITVKPNAPFTKKELAAHLESNLIETRPVEASDITQQPVIEMFKHRIQGDLKNSRLIHANSFFIGNHQGIGKDEREYVADTIEEFVKKAER